MMWPGSSLTSYAIVGAVAMLAESIKAPATAIAIAIAIAMAIELTGTVSISAPIVLAVGAALLSRRLDLRSVYSGCPPLFESAQRRRRR